MSALRDRLPILLKLSSILHSSRSRWHREQTLKGSWTTSQRSYALLAMVHDRFAVIRSILYNESGESLVLDCTVA